MSHPIPEDAQRLADRLRMLAEEIESAARYGIPIPFMVSATGTDVGSVTFHLDSHAEFGPWVDYTEADVREYDLADKRWASARADVNGLPVSFATCHPLLEVAS